MYPPCIQLQTNLCYRYYYVFTLYTTTNKPLLKILLCIHLVYNYKQTFVTDIIMYPPCIQLQTNLCYRYYYVSTLYTTTNKPLLKILLCIHLVYNYKQTFVTDIIVYPPCIQLQTNLC